MKSLAGKMGQVMAEIQFTVYLSRVANKSGKLGSQGKSGNFSRSGKVREIQNISGIEKKFHENMDVLNLVLPTSRIVYYYYIVLYSPIIHLQLFIYSFIYQSSQVQLTLDKC